jgi:peptidyl-prolyl cis-trans isomerase B (cyclophilin B)
MKRLLIVALAVFVVVGTAAAGDHPKVVLETSKGKIVLELSADKAPQTVKNFLAYLDAGFYNNTKDNDFLNHTGKTPQGWGYAVFGRVVEGMAVVDNISKVKTVTRGGFRDMPATPIVITRAARMP